MRFYRFLLIASGLLAGAARADDATARALVEEAIGAHGGEAMLAKWPVTIVKTEGIFHGYDRTPVFFFTSETTSHGPDQWRSVMEGKISIPNGEANPQKFRVVNVLEGEKGWIQLAGGNKQLAQECTPAQLAEMQEGGYVRWVTTLLPLRNPGFTLALAGEEKDGDRPMLGVRVSSPGHRDLTLYFDKENRLLVKTETWATAGTGVEGKVETFTRNHKAYQGVQRPSMWMVYHNGRPLITHWVREYRLAEKPADGTFSKP